MTRSDVVEAALTVLHWSYEPGMWACGRRMVSEKYTLRIFARDVTCPGCRKYLERAHMITFRGVR